MGQPKLIETIDSNPVPAGDTLSTAPGWFCAAFPKLEKVMSWKTPKIAEVCVGMEINMYACATRK